MDSSIFDKALGELGFIEKIEDLIMAEWYEYKKATPNLTPLLFTRQFIENFHNQEIEVYAPDYVKARNKRLVKAYNNIIQEEGTNPIHKIITEDEIVI